MAKTFTNLTVANATAGNAILASDHASAFTTLNSHTVPPMVRAFSSTSLSLTNVTPTVVPLASESYDTDAMHDTATNTSRITFATAGVYLIVAEQTYDINATGARDGYITLNGTTRIAETTVISAGAATFTQLQITAVYSFSASDYIEMFAYQNSGGSLNLRGDVTNGVWMTATFLGKTS